MNVIQTVTAIPAGKLADGSPVTRRQRFEVVRDFEHEFAAPGTTRLLYRVPADPRLGREFEARPIVVRTDSIEVEEDLRPPAEPVKLRIALEVTIDPESWALTYGTPEHGPELLDDLLSYVLTQVQGSPAASKCDLTAAIVNSGVVVGKAVATYPPAPAFPAITGGAHGQAGR